MNPSTFHSFLDDIKVLETALEKERARNAKLREALEKYRGLCVHWNVNHHETCFKPADEALKAFEEGGE